MSGRDYSDKSKARKFYKSKPWELVRQRALERDNFECQWCKAEGGVTLGEDDDITLEVDHIKEFEKHPELALDIDNLRTLCHDCHNKRHKRFNYDPENVRELKWNDERW